MSLVTSTRNAFFVHFAEDVIYHPRGGSPRTIKAVVDRQPRQALPEVGTTLAAFQVVEVRNVATSVDDDGYGGIASSEIDLNGDEIELPVRVGAPAEKRRLTEILTQDEGVLKLEVR